jgi:hypothetical protein
MADEIELPTNIDVTTVGRDDSSPPPSSDEEEPKPKKDKKKKRLKKKLSVSSDDEEEKDAESTTTDSKKEREMIRKETERKKTHKLKLKESSKADELVHEMRTARAKMKVNVGTIQLPADKQVAFNALVFTATNKCDDTEAELLKDDDDIVYLKIELLAQEAIDALEVVTNFIASNAMLHSASIKLDDTDTKETTQGTHTQQHATYQVIAT